MASLHSRELRVDESRCQGHARCLEEAPKIFGVTDDTGFAFVLPDADLEAHASEIETAIAACPESAISWVDQ